MGTGIKASGVGFSIGGHELLAGVSLAVRPGQLCAIVGPSGAGKSTLLKVLCGIKRPSSGRVTLGGEEISRIARTPDRIGYVPQDDIVHRPLTVERVLRYAAELRMPDASPAARKARVEEVLKLLGLADRRQVRVRRLSGGQRKRVSIGVELVTEPAVLFLDEPTSGLDPGLERQLMHTLRELASGERTVLLTTHVMETMDVVDLLAVVCSGRLAFCGPPARALEFFRVDKLRLLFDQLGKRGAAAWAGAFERERTRLSLPAASAGEQAGR